VRKREAVREGERERERERERGSERGREREREKSDSEKMGHLYSLALETIPFYELRSI
jgi:hypothetical protein